MERFQQVALKHHKIYLETAGKRFLKGNHGGNHRVGS